MTTLTDRYTWGVLRAVPEARRSELEPEIRALIADAIEARAAGSPTDAAAAERAALTELGDPEVLASRYTGRSLHLIGPGYFLEFRRLLVLLVSIVVPVVTLAVVFGGFIAGTGVTEALASGVSAGFTVGVQLAFWVTLVFALVERYGAGRGEPILAWTPDRLPSLPSPSRLGARETVAAVVSSVVVILVLAWGPPFIVQGHSVPFFDPALRATWFPWLIAVAVARIVFTLIVYASGRWTWPTAAVNAALDAAFALPLLWLLQTGQLLSPETVAEMESIGAAAAIGPTTAVVMVTIVAFTGWDALDGLLRARRASKGA